MAKKLRRHYVLNKDINLIFRNFNINGNLLKIKYYYKFGYIKQFAAISIAKNLLKHYRRILDNKY